MGINKFTTALLLTAAILFAPLYAMSEDRVAMNFKDADIEAVVQFISELTGKNFILDDAVANKKVTVISPTRVSSEEAYEVFQAILGVKDLTIVPSGSVFKIVPTQKARQSNIETVDNETPPGDRYVTRLVTPKYVEAAKAAEILTQLRSPNSSIVTYEPTNLLIITEAYSNIERLIEILDAIDIETVDVDMKIVELKYAAADAVANVISQAITQSAKSPRTARRTPSVIAAGKGGAAQPAVQVSAEEITHIIPDSRTNKLFIISDTDTLDMISSMIDALDIEMPTGTGKIRVLHLKYADADNVASVLTSISKAVGTKTKPGQGDKATPSAQVATAAPTNRATQVPVNFEEPVHITADAATNSLVIIAAPQDFITLKGVIAELDVRRPQVLVEALIMEMGYQRSLELGVEWRTTTDYSGNNTTVVGATNFGEISSLSSLATNPLAGPSGLFLAAIDGTVEVGGVTFPNIGALVKALQKKGDVDVLSTPHLLTTDNEEAEIIVSDNIPFQTSEKFDSNGNPIYTYEYRDVGMTLRFTPQINDEDYVKLNLFQEISDVLSVSTGGSSNAPSTTKRSAKTTVVIKDGATVVIGGLLQDDSQLTGSSVPCLGDLPLIGALFRSNSRSKDKSNLMIFLTPHIIRESADLEEITRDKAEEHERFSEDKMADDNSSVGDKLHELISNELDPNPASKKVLDDLKEAE